MRIVAVDPPGLEDAIHGAVVPGSADVVHDLLTAALRDRPPDPPADVVEGRLPGHPLPAALAAIPDAPEGMEDPLRVLHLVDRGRSLGADTAAASRMNGVPLEAPDLARLLVDVGEEPAGGLAVEADRRDELVAPLDLPRPRGGVVLDPVVPPLGRRIGGVRAGRGPDEGLVGLLFLAHAVLQLNGTDCPAKTQTYSHA